MNVCTSSSTAQPAAGAKLLRFAIAETEPAWICSCVKGFCSKYMGGGRAATKNITGSMTVSNSTYGPMAQAPTGKPWTKSSSILARAEDGRSIDSLILARFVD